MSKTVVKTAHCDINDSFVVSVSPAFTSQMGLQVVSMNRKQTRFSFPSLAAQASLPRFSSRFLSTALDLERIVRGRVVLHIPSSDESSFPRFTLHNGE